MTTPTPNLDALERIANDFNPMAVPITQDQIRWLIGEAREAARLREKVAALVPLLKRVLQNPWYAASDGDFIRAALSDAHPVSG